MCIEILREHIFLREERLKFSMYVDLTKESIEWQIIV